MTNPMSRRALRAALAVAAAAILVAPAAMAQVSNAQVGGFGTRVKVGDFDYLPLTKRASSAIRIAEWDAGIVGDVRDNCVLLMMDSTDGGPARAVPGALPAPAVVYAKDIRMTPCQGKGVGTPVVDADVIEQTAAYLELAAEVRYGDANGNGKYDRTDPLYLTTMTGVVRGLAPSTAAGAWTVRLTSVGGLPAGSFVFPTDADFISHRTIATGYAVAGGTPSARTWSLAEREGNGWYFVPAAPGGLAAQSAIPVNALRIGLVGVSGQQPVVIPSTIQLPSEPPQAGELYKVAVKYSNDGTGSGAGLLVTKVDGVIVDARMTPVLGPGEVGQVVIPVPMPEHAGTILLAVGDSKVHLDVEGPAAEEASDGTSALEARIAQLEARLAEQDADVAPAKAASVGAPSPMPLALLGVLLGVVLLLRRRAA